MPEMKLDKVFMTSNLTTVISMWSVNTRIFTLALIPSGTSFNIIGHFSPSQGTTKHCRKIIEWRIKQVESIFIKKSKVPNKRQGFISNMMFCDIVCDTEKLKGSVTRD